MTKSTKTKNKKSYKIRSTKGLSKKRLVLFGAIFAIVGVAAALYSFADVISNPTHIIDDQWNLPVHGSGYTDVSVDITPRADGSPNGYFYAHEFYFPNSSQNGNTGYIGLQSEGNNGVDNGYQIIPKMIDFQIWNITSGTPVSGGWGTSFGGEGTGYSVRLAYNWQVNHTYRMDVYLQTPETSGNQVWAAKVTDLNTGVVTPVGSLNTPVSFGLLQPATITFHERFSGPTSNCSDIVASFVTFANVTANSGSVAATPSNPPSIGVNQSLCPGFVYTSVEGSTVNSGYGPNISSYIPKVPAPSPTPPPTHSVPAPTKTSAPTTPKPSSVAATPPPANPTPAPTSPPAATSTAPKVSINTEQMKVESVPTAKHSKVHPLWPKIVIGLLLIGAIGAGIKYYLARRAAGPLYY